MENINSIIGNNFNKIRRNKGYSLDKVAELSSVSKGMLGQIERGETNPSVSTLMKIAYGLHVPFTSLIEAEPLQTVLIKNDDNCISTDDDNKYRAYGGFSYDFNKKFETLRIDLDPGCQHRSEPHEPGIEEYIYVIKGNFKIVVDGDDYSLEEGDSFKFPGNKVHEFINNSDSLVKIHLIIYYNEA